MSLIPMHLALMLCLVPFCKADQDTRNSPTLIYGESKCDWEDARRHCQGLGGDLVSITSQKEMDEVEAVITLNGGSENQHWIGLSFDESDGSYEWSDGTSRTYFENWWPGRPGNSYLSRDCVVMNKVGVRYYWFDEYCSGSYRRGRTSNYRFLCSV